MAQPGQLLHAWLRLSLTPGVGPAAIERLLGALGGITDIVASSRRTLRQFIDTDTADAIVRGPDEATMARALQWAEDAQQAILCPDDPRYPTILRESPGYPSVLYAAGRLELLQKPALAIVGSRNATAQGMRDAEAFARAISRAGCCIVSGLALGIDAAAHRGGMSESGSSIAVLGNGIDVVYPRRNAELYQELRQKGLLLSEFALGTSPGAANFPRRNRIISGLSCGCLVVEAALPSGSLITARIAADLGREVFAIPGSIHSPLAKGCHHLIKQGAKLVESASDVLEEIHLRPQSIEQKPATQPRNSDQDAVLSALAHAPCSAEVLAQRAKISIQRVLAALTELEICGDVARVPGGLYQRLV